MSRILLLAGILLFSNGCATFFSGSPTVSNGPAGCREKCSKWGMELAGMVAMGEFSDGCICQVPGASQKSATQDVAGAGAAVAGVEVHRQMLQRNAAAQGHMGAAGHH